MCLIDSLKTIPRKAFRFKRSEYGYTARYLQYEINIGRIGAYWWWDISKGDPMKRNNPICESDKGYYKTEAKTYMQAQKRAITQLNKLRKCKN